ncbi:unnamed protein product [Rhizoctonia solani]|uniref:Nephrocystin 3-like N-terminal domain-containing protein n=1 Tax=Rhizoctonia solani TaxID=456999 RepID=A0A8H3C8G1_9AGAM|nr:unnamed protein product [Rhizoctonia solani]
MSSQYPPDSQEKRGVRQTIRTGVKWLKGAVRGPSSAPSANPERLPVPNIGSQNLSLSRPITPLLAPTPPAGLEMDRGVITPPPAPCTQASVPNTQVDNPIEHKKSENAALNRLTSILRALESSVELFPPLKSAVGALIGSLDILQKISSNRAEYEDLADEFELLAKMVSQYADELESEPRNGSIANIAQCIQRQVTDIEQKEASGTAGRLWNATQDQENVIRRYRQVERLFRQLQHDLTMRTRSDVKKQLEITLLQRISPVDDAKYNSAYSNTIRRHRCTAKTREAIHQTLQNWTTNPSSEKIYWMNGMAGTGKTTIAYSFCEWLEETNRLGGSFFCSRISSTCRSLSQIIPTLAYQLARFSPAFRSKLCAILNDDPDAGKLNVVQQFEKLINQPMLNARDAMPDSVVFVIDALDECDDNYSVRLLLDLLLKFAEQLPLKFFVSSRPEHVIRDRMMSQAGSSRFIVYLHDIEQSIVEEDIKKYITEALSPMEPSPSLRQIELLAKRSRNLFIYAATVVRYIYPEDVPVDSSERLESMLKAISNAKGISDNRYEDLDLLYTTVLSAIFKSRLGDSEKDYTRRVLWTVVSAKEPIIHPTIALLARLTERQVSSALQSLRSVVHVPENSSLVSTLHASFPEYMLDKSRSKEFCCNESKSNEMMVHRCFDVMKLELKFNICALENSYLTDDQVSDLESRVTNFISPTLSYACRHWGSHLLLAPAIDNTRDMLLDFLSTRLLFWMEAISLSRCIGIGAPMMQQAQTWLRQIEYNRDEIQKQVSDARNFVTWFAANPCSQSTPHIYISALPLCAKSSWVYQHYFQRTQGLANISIRQHDEAVLAIWSVKSAVKSAAISPDGNRIASGSEDGSIQVYDMHTGAVVAGPFNGHQDAVHSIAFSPSGMYIASGSSDQTTMVWDAHTGRIVTGPLLKHLDWVWSVAFSPDGKRIVSGFGDGTIVVWDTYTGAIILGPLEGHTGDIYSVDFSPDGNLIASGSADETIRLWDTFTGSAAAKPFKGHQSLVSAVVFSPDGTKLASCSHDRTIRVWDIKSGTIIGQPYEGHKGKIWSIAFSHDNSYIVSGGEIGDNSIMVWETSTGSVTLGPFTAHTNKVGSVMFSPDDTRIVSGASDRTIRIWDVQSKNIPDQKSPLELSVGPIALLPNHAQLISNSSSGIIQVWDMHTGMVVPHKFEETKATMIHSITVSSQGILLAAGIDDSSIRVWNILTGKVASQPLQGHKDLVRCLAFSPDHAQLCSGSDDATILVWDIEAGTMASSPYQGHTGPVVSVTFSPDGTHIASGATDCTVRIWNLSTCALVHTLNGHKASVSSVVFSPDGNVVLSGSVDGAVQKWEVGAVDSGILFTDDYSNSDSDSDSDFSSDRVTSINWVCFSPDGTHIASGFRSSIRLFDAQSTKRVSELRLPQNEKLCWVGYSLDGTDIVSVSTYEYAGAQRSSEDSQPRQSPQRPNIIRVWRVAVRPGQITSSSSPFGWSYESDGRVLSSEGFVMWIPPDLTSHMQAHTKIGSRSHYNSLTLSSDGFVNIGHRDLFIGNRWTQCYLSND